MRKALFLGALALGTVACEPDIAQDAAPSADDLVVAEFDPSASPAVVPSPNDLAIVTLPDGTKQVAAPVNPATPAAEQEFTKDYLNSLNGFPTTATAATTVKGLNPATVTAETVKFLDVYEGTPLAKPVTPVIGYREETNQITLNANGGWPKGGRYAVFIIGGEKGPKTTKGKGIIGSATWGFASSKNSLVTCEDLTDPTCSTATELIPSVKTDPAERLADQTNSALRLEQVRRAYAPLLDAAVAKFGVAREDIVLAWTFSVVNQPEATFNPDVTSPTLAIPFPNDLLRANGKLNLPGADPSTTSGQLIAGLNTLDGWSTTAPIISENNAGLGAIDTGSKLDPNTLVAGKSVLLIKLTPGGTTPKYKVCLNCASSTKRDGSPANPAPEQLQIVPEVPLDGGSQYAVVMLKGIKDTTGRTVATPAAQALIRLSSTLAVNGKSQVSAVPDANAAALEPVRAGMKPVFDALAAKGIARKDIVLAWVFTTQSTRSVLEQLNAAPNAVPADPIFLQDQTPQLKGAMAASSLDNSSVGRAFVGTYYSPFLLDDVQGALNPARTAHADHVPFWLFLPSTAAPAGGYKVVVFGHGLTSNRTAVLSMVNNYNRAGYAVAAIDAAFHGDRASCAGLNPLAGLGSTLDSPDEACNAPSTCDVTPNSATFGRCVSATAALDCDPRPTAATPGDETCRAANQGVCLPSGKCEGGDFKRSASGVPLISGWNYLNLTNLFATRDNFRHSVVDIAQLTRMLASDGLQTRLSGASAGTLNAATVDYVGQSLGSFHGTMVASVNTRVRNVALNVPGGDLVDTLLLGPAFAPQRNGFLDTLEAQGRVSGTPAFDEFIVLARTILDPAAPRNYGWFLANAPSAPEGRKAFIQYITGDQVIPNAVTEPLIASANRDSTKTVQSYLFDLPFLPAQARHPFMLVVDSSDPGNATLKAVRDQAQGQIIEFFNTGVAPQP
ncbi:hypothetical protein LZ198_40595 [Myxococcus sp. K15C18031901]|uniref:hypothetical protein n=1 Tax=Myxococcus dinghuensis TaxID=2906761 RepID=UPI0020A70DFD|nr:hypothetical protein [Myxococcus dinghuensis]MCP3105187.1 hypothetical protein [Myxococcus dinghuensis]